MRRFSALLLTFALAPGLAAQTSSQHTVVDGETLWGLAERYCADPFRWPEIFSANQSQISDPDLILPGQILSIACAPASETPAVTVQAPVDDEPMADPEPEVDERARRTVFYRDLSSEVGGANQRALAAMSRDHSWGAAWLDTGDGSTESMGQVVDLLADVRARTAMPYQRIRIRSDRRVSMGDAFLTYRISRTIRGVGQVAIPTGAVSVVSTSSGGFEAVVLKSYDRVAEGDMIVPVPDFDIETGDEAQAVSSNQSAQVLAFGESHAVQQIGDVALLDVGSNGGVSLGDEYVLMVGSDEGFDGRVGGRLQVIRVTPQSASARIVSATGDHFNAGVEVRLDKKMR